MVTARRAQLASSRLADDAALRQEKIQHRSTLGVDVYRNSRGSVEAVGLALRQAGLAAKPVVRLEQLRVAPDVVPARDERIAVDSLAVGEPAEKVARVVGAVALGNVGVDERDVLGREEVDQRRG